MSNSPRRVAALLLLVVVPAAWVLLHDETESGSGPVAAVQVSEAELIERGRYLAIAGNCASCHTSETGAFMAGGLAFRTPFGTLYSSNITSDPDTGIGGWSDRDLLNAMRHGVRPDGTQLYPAFPYTAYTKVSNEDVAALRAWLRTVPAVRAAPPDNDLQFPFSLRPLMAFWKLLFFEPGAFVPDPDRPQEWNRGAYLVEALAHCSACHSPRNLLGAERAARAMSGGELVDRVTEDGYRPWSAPNLTSAERGLGNWSRADLAAYLKHARNDFLEAFGPMNDVIMNSTRYLSAADVDAMALYLKSLPAIDEAPAQAPGEVLLGRGRSLYNLHCGTCHLPTGLGDPEMAPRLGGGSLVVRADDPASMINAILYGPHAPQPALPPKWRHPMKAFRYLLDDDEVAAVASFVRHSWDNGAPPVTAEQVARQRLDVR